MLSPFCFLFGGLWPNCTASPTHTVYESYTLQVTWTRRLGGDTGGIQLLSVGDYTHVQDNRFRVEKKPHDAVSGIVYIVCKV